MGLVVSDDGRRIPGRGVGADGAGSGPRTRICLYKDYDYPEVYLLAPPLAD